MPLMATVTSDPGAQVDGLAVVPLPSWPSTFSPQHRIVPSPRSAHACPYPLATATAPVSPLTATGDGAKVPKVPSPRCPDSPSPQHLTVPSPRSAHANSSPAATRVAVVRPLTATRTEESLRVPLPSCPNWFRPTHCAVPSGRSTQVYCPPAETAAVGARAPLAVNCCVLPTPMLGLAVATVMAVGRALM